MNFFKDIYFNRKPDSIKSDFGKTLIIAGSKKYPGASFIASQFAELAGVGYVALSVPETIYTIAASKVSNNIIYEFFSSGDDFIWSDDYSKVIKGYNSVLFGNGVNDSISNLVFLKNLIATANNLVIDGTGLNIIANNVEILKRDNKNKILLTPHLGELKRLLKIDDCSRNPNDYLLKCKEFCQKYNVNVLIKSYSSILVLENQTFLNSNYAPTPSLARAGSGDALAGYITGLLAYATAKFDYQMVIMEADKAIHEAAMKFSKINSDGTLNSNKLSLALEDLIRDCKLV